MLLALPFAGALVGLVVALAFPWPLGPGHSCPSGAPVSSCFYPADVGEQRVLWALFGFVVGVLASMAVRLVASRRTQS